MDLLQPTVFVSNLCYLIKLWQLFPACFIYTTFVTLAIFVALSNFCHLLTLWYLLSFYVIYEPYKCTYTTHHTHQYQHLSTSPGVFGHRPILMWGDRGMAGGFLLEQPYQTQDNFPLWKRLS